MSSEIDFTLAAMDAGEEDHDGVAVFLSLDDVGAARQPPKSAADERLIALAERYLDAVVGDRAEVTYRDIAVAGKILGLRDFHVEAPR